MCAPAVALAGTALSAVGQYQSGQAAASAQNSAARAQYKYQLKIREKNWNHERQRYATKLGQYGNQLAENNAAAYRAYASEQRKLNDVFKKAAFAGISQKIEATKAYGKMSASGSLGKSAERADDMVLMQLGMNQAIQAESLFSAQTAFDQTVGGIRRQQLSANNKAFSQVAVAPEPDVAPPPPAMAQGPSPLSLMGGLLGAGADFGTAMANIPKPAQPGGFTPKFDGTSLFGSL
jgi:hypothetical protein